jgi:hypothetical protein
LGFDNTNFSGVFGKYLLFTYAELSSMQLIVTGLTERYQVLRRIRAMVAPENDMMAVELGILSFAFAMLTGIVVSMQDIRFDVVESLKITNLVYFIGSIITFLFLL